MKTYACRDHRRQDSSGFSLIEVLVTVMVIAVLTVFMVPQSKGIAERRSYNAIAKLCSDIATAQQDAISRKGAGGMVSGVKLEGATGWWAYRSTNPTAPDPSSEKMPGDRAANDMHEFHMDALAYMAGARVKGATMVSSGAPVAGDIIYFDGRGVPYDGTGRQIKDRIKFTTEGGGMEHSFFLEPQTGSHGGGCQILSVQADIDTDTDTDTDTDDDCPDPGNACIQVVKHGESCFQFPIDCNDNNDCTADTCRPVAAVDTNGNPLPAGCVHTDLQALGLACFPPCEDGINVCNSVSCTDPTRVCACCEPCEGTCEPIECNEHADCEDGDACTDNACLNGQCLAPIPRECNFGDPCKKYWCDATQGCMEEPLDPDNPENPDPDKCLPLPECEDPNIAVCNAVSCQLPWGSNVKCNCCEPCEGTCEPKECQAVADCEDYNECTENSCVNNLCMFFPIEIDDRDPCTIDSCDKNTGVKHEPVPDQSDCLPIPDCDDPNQVSVCNATSCQQPWGSTVKCACCDICEGTCVKQCNAALDCNDDNACTEDKCIGGNAQAGDPGICQNAPIVCKDADACTMDACDPAAGCVFPAMDCGDGDPCTVDSCKDGKCVNEIPA